MVDKSKLIKEIRASLDMWREDLFRFKSTKLSFEEMDIHLFTDEQIADFFDQFDNELKKLSNKKENNKHCIKCGKELETPRYRIKLCEECRLIEFDKNRCISR